VTTSASRLSAVTATVLLLLLTACSATAPPAPTATPPPPAPSATVSSAAHPVPAPSATRAPAASPRPAIALPSVGPTASATAAPATPVPSPSPSPTPRPAPTLEAIGPVAPIAVLVDNIAEARPHSGLADADVVYEAPAEGGIPRLMPIYFTASPTRVGPVRSARHYYVYLAAEYGAALVHIGASPQGFQALSLTALPDVDEIRNGPGFSRDRRRYAPHNAYINLAAVRQALEAAGTTLHGSPGGLEFGSASPPADGQPLESLEIDYPGGERYVVQYTYDGEARTYLRGMDGAPHRDAETGQQYAARAVIVQFVPAPEIAGDDKGRLDVEVVGEGKGLLALDGQLYPITWSKAGPAEPTHYRYADGGPVVLPRGQVWIQIAPDDSKINTR